MLEAVIGVICLFVGYIIGTNFHTGKCQECSLSKYKNMIDTDIV